MIYASIQLFPGGAPSSAQHIGHVAIVNVTPTDDPADYVAVPGERLDVERVLRVNQHRRSDGWSTLLARATNEPGESVADTQALAVADRAQQIVVEANDNNCALGHPVRRLRRLAGDRWPIAERALKGRATTTCTGWLCGGTAHGEVIVGDACQDALAALLDADADAAAQRSPGSRRRRPWRRPPMD